MKRKLGLILVVCLVFGIFFGCGKVSQNEDEKKIRIGSNRALGASAAYVAQELNYFEGQNVEIIDFANGAQIMEAMAAGELDICIVGAMPVAIWNAKGIDVRIVSGINNGGHVILTKADSGIESVADLAGKKLAVPAPGTVTDVIFRGYVLPQFDLEAEDVVFIDGIAPADMAGAMMGGGEVDAIITWEPFASVAEQTYGKDIRVIYDFASEWKEKNNTDMVYPVNVIAVNGSFLDENEDNVEEVVEALYKAIDYINTDAEADNTIAKVLQMDVEIVKMAKQRSVVSSTLDKEAIMECIEKARDLGYIEELPNEETLFDERFKR